MTADDLAAIVATARSLESDAAAERRGTLDIVIAGLAFHAGLRRSEIAGLRAADVQLAASVPGVMLVQLRASKTNPDGGYRQHSC